MKKRIPLIAKSIDFTSHAIIYKVELSGVINFKSIFNGIVVSNSDIKNKDLILKTNYLDEGFEVCFVPVHVIPEFYQKILHEKTSKLAMEHRKEVDDIYAVGDCIGYVMV